MYKNTVPKAEREQPTMARVRKNETDAELAAKSAQLVQSGRVEFVFSDQALLECWRQRVAALA